MKTRVRAAAVVRWALLLAFVRLPLSPGPAERLWDARKIEAYLRSARVTSVEKDVESGRTNPWRIGLDDGTSKARAVFKHVDRRRPRPLPDSFKYEIAAYELSRLLGLDFVPPIVEREIAGTKGGLEWYIEGCVSERDRERTKLVPPDLEAFYKQLDAVQLFEALTADKCQDKDDILIHRDTWKVCRVDFSEAFGLEAAVPDECGPKRCPRGLFDRLRETTRPALADRLRSWLSSEEIAALWERKHKIVARLQELVREKGEAAVIYGDGPEEARR